jgi:hypothetical protein
VSRLARTALGLTLLVTAACGKEAASPVGAASPAEAVPVAPPRPAPPPLRRVAPAALAAPPDVAAPPKEAKRTKSGLLSMVIRAGSGTEHPGAHDRVKVHYTGWTKDGGMFDSSVTRGVPKQFVVDRVILGWSEGLQLMVRGEKRRFWIPSKLAYGDAPTRPGLPAGPLTFDIELIDISKVNAANGPTGSR